MPAAYPREFRQRAVLLAREGSRPVTEVARELGISVSGLRRWVAQAEIDDGSKPGLGSSEIEELRRLRKENRVLKMERELLSRAAAFFASENVLPK